MKDCEFNMNGFKMQDNINILPLGSYDMLIGMDWVEKHRVIFNCYDKTLSCIDKESNTILVKWIPSKTIIREISTLQMKRFFRKGCKVFLVHIIDHREKYNQVKVDDILILRDFKDVVPK